MSMSIAGYLIKRGYTELRMPKHSIRSEGLVMSGEKSVEEQRRQDAIRATSCGGESYKSVKDYDPVLRAHCRL